MTVKIGINGFGRIGRQVLKAVRDLYPNKLEVTAFNDIGDLKTMAHLLKYDSNYGRFDGSVEVESDALVIDGRRVKVFKETDEPLVSIDYKGDPHSSSIDLQFTMALGKEQSNFVKVVTWYDNEWGYSCRTADLAALIALCESLTGHLTKHQSMCRRT